MTQPSQIPISRVSSSYYLFNISDIVEVRNKHNIPGLLTGTLPQAGQQSVFLGLPLQLMPEESRLLCEKGIAFIFDDTAHHSHCSRELEKDSNRRNQWMTTLHDIGAFVVREAYQQKESDKQRALGRMGENAAKKKERRAREKKSKVNKEQKQEFDTDLSLFTAESSAGFNALSSQIPMQSTNLLSNSLGRRSPEQQQVHTLTPTTSYPPLARPSSSRNLPVVPSSYSLFKYLHTQSYFLSPGLRFGCQYMAYPGDPLRYHSHFMVVGRDWDEEVELRTLIGLGRLGTGVKKGVVMGGIPAKASEVKHGGSGANAARKLESNDDEVRCFTIEWGGM